MEPTFKTGDLVMFELGPGQRPRWDHHTDRSGTGIWDTGVVVQTYQDTHKMAVKSDTNNLSWLWLLGSHKDSLPEQWNRPGYLRLMYTRNIYLHHNAEIVTYDTNI